MLLTSATKVGSTNQVAVTRAIRFLSSPLTPVKLPPIRMFPSACIAMAVTALFTFPVNPGSARPVAVRRAKRSLGDPPIVVNDPHTKILSSAWTTIFETVLPAAGLNVVSFCHVTVKRAIRFLVTPLTEVNVHPMMIFPSDCRSIVLITLFTIPVNHGVCSPVEVN